MSYFYRFCDVFSDIRDVEQDNAFISTFPDLSLLFN